ncbi:Aldo/keto reductase [Gonapodya prolifera JEL478]|uniref:Aldo/keto reductase n=1 Tax=Gonapodya prolifera (strain JEL478) TaxID=1344416 RepID=A0A139AIG4_GONPJ|nr:Aldo/keto reductase [Gonapodya prolifera JEL478]|eukprot:KXS16601.1 Aldo/keto reductase [Gonapodya prolifera JEL478]
MSEWPTFTLSSRAKIPAVGLGTYFGDDMKLPQDQINNLVETAVRAGYRHFDGALVYGNGSQIGIALARVFDMGLVKREDIFYTCKCPETMLTAPNVRKALEQTLESLQLDYLDLYLLHWPVCFYPSNPPINLEDMWKVMEDLYAEGKVRAIGVSNYTVEMLKKLLTYTGTSAEPPFISMPLSTVHPSTLLMKFSMYESHPYLPQPALLSFCHSRSIHVTAYSPLGAGKSDPPVLLSDTFVTALASTHAAPRRKGCSVTPRTQSVGRAVENFARVKGVVREVVREVVRKVETRKRYVDPRVFWRVDVFGEGGLGEGEGEGDGASAVPKK